VSRQATSPSPPTAQVAFWYDTFCPTFSSVPELNEPMA
jgi:hypothetical protein